MKKKSLNPLLILSAVTILTMSGLTGCGSDEKEAEVIEETEVKEEKETAEEKTSADIQEAETESTEAAQQEEATETDELDVDKMLESYYAKDLLEAEGLIELPAGFEITNTEKHMENYSIGERLFQETGICYHAIWDYDKDDQDEMLVLLLDENEDRTASKIHAKMYEVLDGEVVETAELESFFDWMQFDTTQSTEILLRETKDWFYLAEEAKGFSTIYADGSAYAIRVAHYDGTDFVVDLAKQMSGSDFSGTENEVADTARLLTYVGFDHSAETLTYEYNFNRKDDLLSVFYMTAEPLSSLDKYYHSGNISDVPAYIIRLFAGRE